MRQQHNCKIKYADGRIGYTNVTEKNCGEYLQLTLSEELNYKTIEYIDFDTERGRSKVGDEGYYCIIQGGGTPDNALCFFKEREDIEYVGTRPIMPFLGVKNSSTCYLGIVTGYAEKLHQIVTLKDGIYKNYFRFYIECEELYEPIEMRIYPLDQNAGYSEMAKTYRNYQLTNKGFQPICEKLTPEMEYATESLYVRIRQAWKPVPTPILEQTLENEPLVHVACTFAQVAEIMDAYKANGIEKAEFCLVGWNIGGHDGRWPQILPVEPSLGGEAGLRAMITHAEELGYLVSCHTNCTDSYSIAQNFNWNDVAKTKDNKCSIQAEYWGGGRTYNVCPEKALQNAKELFPDVRKLGFRGMHYVDVITATPPRNCCHPDHPVNYHQGSDYLSDLLKYSRELFGGSGSEAAYDYSLAGCDYVLYASFGRRDNALTDQYIPLWQLIYNGIVMSNPYSSTVNLALSDNSDDLLKAIEYNGRPAIYYYAKFVSNGRNWIGKDTDFTYENNEQCAKAAKKHYDIFKELAYLQKEFMEKHEEISPNVFAVTYSDGSVVTVDYNTKTYTLIKGTTA